MISSILLILLGIIGIRLMIWMIRTIHNEKDAILKDMCRGEYIFILLVLYITVIVSGIASIFLIIFPIIDLVNGG